MPKEDTTDQLNQLIDLGKEKGFLTYEEVNEKLPSGVFSPEQMDDMMSLFGGMNIEIVEGMQKVTIPKPKLQKVPKELKAETKGGSGSGPFCTVQRSCENLSA